MDDVTRLSVAELSGFSKGLGLMQQLGQAINTASEPGQLIWEIYQQTHKLIPADVFMLALCTDEPDTVDYFGVDKGETLQRRMPVGPLTKWVIEHCKSFLTSDDREVPPSVVPAKIETAIPDVPHAYIFVPLVTRDTVMGVVSVQSYTPGAFTDLHLTILSAIAGHSAAVLQNVRLLTEARQRADEIAGLMERRLDELRALTEIDRAITSGKLQEVLDRIISSACKIIGTDNGAILLVDGSGTYIYEVARYGSAGQADWSRKYGIDQHGVTEQVAHSKQPIRIGDIRTPEWQDIYVPVTPDTQSELDVPILDEQEKLVGVINLESRARNAFSEDDERLLMTLADQAFIAIRNQRQFEAEKRNSQVLNILRQVERAIFFQAASPEAGKLVNLSYVWDLILRLGLDAVEAPSGNIMLYDKVRGDLYMAAERGVSPEHRGQRQNLGEGVVGMAASEKRASRVPDVTVPPWDEIYRPFIADIRSELAVPLLQRGRLVGVLNAESPQVDAFSASDEELFEMLAGQAVIAYQNAERYEALEKLREINQLLTSEYDPDSAIKSILLNACRFIQAEWGNLRLYDGEGHPALDYVVVKSVTEPEPRSDTDIQVIDWRRTKPEACVESGIIAWVAQERRVYRSQGNVQADPKFQGFPGLDIRSEMAAPLIVGQELVGVLNLESEREDAFDTEDEMRLVDFSNQAAIAVRNAQSLEETRQARERFAALNEVGTRIINAPSDVDRILEIVLNEGDKRTGVFHTVAWLPDDEGRQLIARRVGGEYQDERHEPIPFGEYVNGLVWKTWHYFLVEDVNDLPEGITHRPGHMPTRSMLVVPMIAGGEYFGNLDFRHREPHGFKPEEIEFIKGLATQAASAIQRMRREKELAEVKQSEREAQTMASLGLVAGEFMHKISNLLGLTNTYIKRIKRAIGENDIEANQLLDRIRDNVSRTLLLNQRLKEQLADQSSGVERPKKVFLAEAILSGTCQFRPPPATITVLVDPPPANPKVRADDRILDAFINIYINAIEALEQKGGGVIRMSAREVSGWVELEISDDGPGIEPSNLDKMFNLFYSTKKGGLGFGLFSAKQRVLANGGQIHVQSQVGAGTTFIIRLPAAAAYERSLLPSALAEPQIIQTPQQGTDKVKPAAVPAESSKSFEPPIHAVEKVTVTGRVLVVDDLLEWQNHLRLILIEHGFRVDTAASLAEATERFNTQMYHLVIIDMRLEDWNTTDMGGLAVLDEIDRRYGTGAIAKIMCSAYGTPEQLKLAFRQHRVSDFILKEEFNADDFLACVREAFANDVRMNPDLEIILEDSLSFEKMIIGTARAGKRVKKEDPDFPRLAIEVEDLFRRLFYDYARIVVRRVTAGHGKSDLVMVAPFSKDGQDETVIVKFEDYKEIDREYRNYDEFVKGKIGVRTTNVLNLRRTPLLGGIVYSLIGTRVEQVIDLAAFYRQNSADAINAALDDLFKATCANWYADRGVVQYCPLDKMYQDALDFEREQLVEALEANFPYYLDQNILTFRDLPGVHVPNPAYVIRGKAFSRPIFQCTTHGDLNANNILINTEGHTWLVDFHRTGKSHILRDCAQLETVIKFVLLQEENLAERYNLEKALASMSRFKEADALRYEAPNEAYTKAFEVCRKLRQIARDLVQPDDDFSEYEIGLLYCTMNTQRFYSLPKVNRLHALLAAGMLCEKLGLS